MEEGSGVSAGIQHGTHSIRSPGTHRQTQHLQQLDKDE